jgi:hypothetical protein
MPSPLHEVVISTISRGIAEATVGLPSSVKDQLQVTTGEDWNGFGGKYAASEKRADLAIRFIPPTGATKLGFVVEVGFSECYEDLANDAKLWLEGTSQVSVLLLVAIEERPKYRCPVNPSHADLERLSDLIIPTDPAEVKEEEFKALGEFGPVYYYYRGFKWFNIIQDAYIEEWRRDPLTGKAIKHGRMVRIN